MNVEFDEIRILIGLARRGLTSTMRNYQKCNELDERSTRALKSCLEHLSEANYILQPYAPDVDMLVEGS